MVEHAGQVAVKLPETTHHKLGGKVVAAGQLAREALAELFGFAGNPSVAVTAAAWTDHSVEIAVAEGDQVHVFHVERRGPESRGLVLTKHLSVYSRGKDLPLSLAELVQKAAVTNLPDWTMDHLAVLITSDPRSGKPGLPTPPARDEANRPRSLLDTWGANDSYADFFAGGEIARSQLDSIDPSKLFHFVQHCDAECLYVNPHSVGGIVALVNYPWDDRVREPGRPFDQNMANLTDREFIEEGMITTDLVEDDVILGNPKKFEALLDYAVSRPSAEDKLLFVSNTCVPTVIGEDVESVVKRLRKKTGKEILYLTVTPRSMTNVFQGMLVDRRLEAEAKAEEAPADTVNLIGFAGGKGATELDEALATYGARVNVHLLPDLNAQLIESLPNARLNILYPNQLWQHMFEQLLDRSRIAAIDPAAPYGFEGTRTWLEAVAASLDREHEQGELEDLWRQVAEPWQARWDSLRRQAVSHRLGFVVRDEESYFLTNPGASWGVPLIALAEEMGFGIDILVRVSDPKVAKEAALSIRKQFKYPERHSVRAFDSFAFLRKRLEDCPAQAFLSYHFYDWRLSEAGKASFSIQHFEMGAAGAVRTLERLLRVCRTSFYRRYHKHLKRTPQGLHPDVGPRRGGSPNPPAAADAGRRRGGSPNPPAETDVPGKEGRRG